MADSIQNKRSQQTYLRQVQQEKSERKREIMNAQKEDMKSVREYYADQSKQLETNSAAAINHIKEESRQIAAAERQERTDRQQAEIEQKQIAREEAQAARSQNVQQSSTPEQSVEKKNLYARKTGNKAVTQNYETKETDDFYRVQDRGSRVSESAGSYVIEAYAPEHEKDNLRVSIQRNKAVISGQRKFADNAEDGNKTMRTNNFQSFREEFKFDRPISNEGMTRERIGDYIRFSIPKLEAIDSPDENS
ncbi:MAG: Hsp20/alpha crystallin family protein [Pseudobdellovibrio sp.]